MQKNPFSYEAKQKKHLIQVVSQMSEELKCDIEEITAVLADKEVRKAISDMVHFNKYLCSPYRCKACKRNIPHDSHIFDTESIYE